MAEIKVHFSADASALEHKFEEIKHHAKEVGKQLGEVGTDLGKSLPGLDLGKLLGTENIRDSNRQHPAVSKPN
jgi:hypothetical protein